VVPVIVFGLAFGVMIPARSVTVLASETTAGTADAANPEIGTTLGSVEVDQLAGDPSLPHHLGEVPLIAIVAALALSIGLLVSSLGPRGLTVLMAIGDRGRGTIVGSDRASFTAPIGD
jgi:hypothetical protein